MPGPKGSKPEEASSERDVHPGDAGVDPSVTTGLKTKHRLGDFLLKAKLVTERQLQEAITLQQKEGGFVGQILLRLGYVTQEAVASCLVKQCKIPHISLLDYEISPEVIELISKDICLRYNLLPIDRLGRILTVAMTDPLDISALEAVRKACPSLTIKPILCNWRHFEIAVTKVFPKNRGKSAKGTLTVESLGLAGPPKPSGHGTPDAQVKTMKTKPVAAAEAAKPGRTALGPVSNGAALPDDLGALLRETLEQSVAGLANILCDAQAVLVEQIRKSLDSRQYDQESRLTEIAESIALSVRETAQWLEKHEVSDAARHGLAPRRQGRFASVSAFGNPSTGETHEAEDGQVLKALGSERPIERLTFDCFLPGEANAFTYKLGQAVARAPGTRYNPFFLYGNVGTGKTHLISAIGNAILTGSTGARPKEDPPRVGYVSASHFSRRWADALRIDAQQAFRENYCHWDVLILDDIQFFGGRVEAQEEFFHIFNVLHQHERQIIIASDKPPDRLGMLEQRLVSRFASGIVAELKAPEWETRMAILRRLLEDAVCGAADAGQSAQAGPPEEVLSLIAMRVQNDVRKMTGALHKIVAFADLVGHEITCEMADEILSHLSAEQAA